MYELPDPVELSEARQERMAEQLHMVGDYFICPVCEQWRKLSGSVPMGPGPDAMPMCGVCANAESEAPQ